ncbi:MAG TPA: glycosyltransferase family 1 protein [Acidimicrobiales bacterium]|jgi:alpha-1,3-rhamnosyl/mannosyltransferase|nr:glycosyltransferase family 1 protein [Acidimicrobiales bacterium]
MSARVLLVPHRLHDPLGTGIHRYGVELIRALGADESRAEFDYAVASIDDPDLAVGCRVVHIAPPRRALHLSWATLGAPKIERYAGDTDLVHVLTPAVPVATSAVLVETVHDLLPLRFPSWYPARQRWLFGRAVHQAERDAARVIVPSSAVAADLADATDIDAARVTVIPEGVDPIFRRPVSEVDVAAVCARHRIRPGRFFLFVGAVSGRKNLSTALRALAAFRSGGPDVPLVVAGPRGRGADEFDAETRRLGLESAVRVTGFVSAADLPVLLAAARALVHPSKYEGFGLTPLEAMAAGTPVLAANTGALPEVVGDAGVLLPPDDVDAWSKAMTQVHDDDDLRRSMVERGRAWSERFTWERAATETAAVYRACL